MNVAYQERDLKAIRRKARIDYVLRVIQTLFGKFSAWKKATVLPVVQDEATLANVLNRITWYLNKSDVIVNVPVSDHLKKIDIAKLQIPPGQADYLKLKETPAQLVPAGKLKLFAKGDVFLLNDMEKVSRQFVVANIRNAAIIDPNYFSESAAATWIGMNYSSYSKERLNELDSLSEQNFSLLMEKHGGAKKAYCFVTGPSFDQYENYNYDENGIKIICNSIVKNKKFLKYIGAPDILTCADPVFHFGPSLYADSFRREALQVVKEYGCFWVVPKISMGILLDHFPGLEDKLIGIEYGKKFTIPTQQFISAKQFPNILTSTMIPLAAAVAKRIFVLGADGRKSGEKYFWTHSKAAQFNDLMQTAFETHPSFFRDRDYKDYYRQHCKDMERLFQYLEQNGRSIHSLTKSYIPALVKRHFDEQSKK